MSAALTIGIQSKGRLKEQAEDWLADCGFKLEIDGGERGYRASIRGLPDAVAHLLSTADIAAGLDQGDLHVGIIGEDLMRERGGDVDQRILLLRPLGFGRADLVVAAPQSWIDVEDMADVDDVAAAFLARTGRRMRVATKYLVQTRAFFARHGIVDYRIVESSGATEGAPAAGGAELIVDITTTGATLAANSLKILSDGVILKSQAQLAAALTATWTPDQLGQLRRLVSVAEARAHARELAALHWPAEADAAAAGVLPPFLARGASKLADGVLSSASDLFDLTAVLAEAGVGPVSVSRPDYVFETTCEAIDRLSLRLGL